MILTGVIVNSLSVLFGSLIGSLFKKGISKNMNNTLMSGLAYCVLYIGISGLKTGSDILVIILSVIIGAILGELLDIDKRFKQIAMIIEEKINNKNHNIAQGFVNSTIFVCVGAMSIVGSIESGMQGNFDTFYAKSLIDGVVVFVMATSLGIGCCFSAVIAFIYQSVLTLSANVISQFLEVTIINDISCIGSILIIGISLNMLQITNVKTANFIIAPFLPILIYNFIDFF